LIYGSICGLGATAPNPVLTTIKYFREEYEAHINRRRCPAGVCKNLITYKINPDLCKACGLCRKACLSEAIAGAPKQPHTIDAKKCIKCGACYEACKFEAIVVE